MVSSVWLYSSVSLVVGFGSWIAIWTRQAGVKREMKEFAKANNFELLGKELPDGFVFRGTSLHDPEIANVMKGTLHGADMVVFTASFATKEGNVTRIRTQTVVAFPNTHGLGSRQVPPTGDPNLYLEVAGDWLVLYYRGLVVGKEQLAGWCEKMYAVAQTLTSSVKAG